MRIVIEADESYRSMFLEIANSIKAKISFAEEEDFYENLPKHVINGIKESRAEISRGEFQSHDGIMNKYLEKYK